MDAKELDENKLKKELENLYQRFIENSDDSSIKKEMWNLSGKYAAADDLIYNKIIARALNDLSFFAQGELPDNKNKLFEAKKILEDLRKS